MSRSRSLLCAIGLAFAAASLAGCSDYSNPLATYDGPQPVAGDPAPAPTPTCPVASQPEPLMVACHPASN